MAERERVGGWWVAGCERARERKSDPPTSSKAPRSTKNSPCEISLQITETYAFLPREAVTKFLLQCTDCQRRPSVADSGSPSPPPLVPVAPAPGATPSAPLAGGSAGGAPVTAHPSVTSATPGRLEPPLIDYSLPITTTYLKHMRSLGLTDEEALSVEVYGRQIKLF
jgi:hypothetical protein